MEPPVGNSSEKGVEAQQGLQVMPWVMIRSPIRSCRHFFNFADAPDSQSILRDTFAEPFVNKALKIHSEVLHRAFDRCVAEKTELTDELDRTLYRYFARFTTRATPLASFAGVGTARVGNYRQVVLSPPSAWRLGVFPSWSNMSVVARGFLDRPGLRGAARFRLNETCNPRGGVICYFTEKEVEPFKNLATQYQLVSMRYDKQLRPLIEAMGRWWSWDELSQIITREVPEATPEMVEEYLFSMVDGGILHDSLQPPTIGPRPERFLYDLSVGSDQASDLKRESERLLALCDQPQPIADDSFEPWWDALNRHPWVAVGNSTRSGANKDERSAIPLQLILQIDSVDGGVPEDLLVELGRCVSAFPFLWEPNEGFAAIRAAIVRTMSGGTTGSHVPLLDLVFRVLKGPELQNMVDAEQRVPVRHDPSAARWKVIASYLSKKAFEAEARGLTEVELDPAEWTGEFERQAVARVAEERGRYLETFCQAIRFGGEPALHVYQANATPGYLSNRFLHWDQHDPLLEQLRTIWDGQSRDVAPAVIAEITCGGCGRLKDLTQRPLTYPYQIVVNGQPSVPADRQIHLAELSVYNDRGRPMLWWDRKGVPVIARQLSALDRESLSPVGKVLLALDPLARRWSFPRSVPELPVGCPRFRWKRILLAPRSWLVPPHVAERLRRPKKEWKEAELCGLLEGWRAPLQRTTFCQVGGSGEQLA